ncbi:MAG: S8 family serine peptidase [Acidobacteriota bacterium]|nr:S8 family serine peptidase [Acidobacteriota bacterium]
MTSRIVRAFLATIAIAIVPFSLFAQSRQRPAIEAAAAAQKRADTGPMIDLIVQFRQPPAAAAWSATATMQVSAMQARIAALPERLEQFRRDLGGLDSTSRARVRTDAAAEGSRITYAYSRVLFGAGVHTRRDMIEAIRALPYVASVHVARTFQPMVTDNIIQVGADKVWTARATRGKGVVVAVIDTGIDYTHPALGGGIGSAYKVLGGYDFANQDSDPMDDVGHGTHVAGIIAANSDELTGVAPDASLLAYKCLGPRGGTEDAVIAAVERTVDPDQNGDPSDHADIANMSLGGMAQEDDPVAKAVENATRAGVLFCIASGNGGEYGNIPSPAIATSAITVGAVDGDDDLASFSSRGPSWDFSMKPEVVAPGVFVVSTLPNGKTGELSGTSMAAPHVAGVAALVKAVHHDWTPAEIKSAIVSSAAVLQTEIMDIGAGRIDALKATAASILSSVTTVDFGQVMPDAPMWQSTRQAVLRNVTAQPQTLTATVQGLRNGIVVAVTPNVVTLAPGESKTVTFHIALDNRIVPVPREGSLAFGGQIVWNGGATPFHMPWTAVDASFLTIDIQNNIVPVYVEIMGDHLKRSMLDVYSRVRKYWRYETVDVVLTEDRRLAGNFPVHVAVAESVNVRDASQRLTMDMDEAKYVIDTTAATDPSGGPLVTADRFCLDTFTLSFPGGKRSSVGQYSEEKSFPPFDEVLRVRFTKFSSRVKVYPLTVCSDTDLQQFLVAAHDRFDGLSADFRTSMHQTWAKQRVQFTSERPDNRGLTVAYAAMQFRGKDEEEYYVNGTDGHLMRGTTPNYEMFFTNSSAPEMRLVVATERDVVCAKGGDCPSIGNVWMYPNANGTLVDSDLYLDTSPMAYRARPNETIRLGDTPAFAMGGFGANSSAWVAGASSKGAMGETRISDFYTTKIAAYDDQTGALLGESTGATIYREQRLPLGRYRAETTLPNLIVAGLPAEGKLVVRTDLSKPDRIVPKYTGLRVVDPNDSLTSVLHPGERASLLFSVADEDVAPSGVSLMRLQPREEATLVEYRPHNGGEWRPLPASVVARQYQNNSFLFAGTGTMYRTDLSAVTSSYTGAIDLRLHVEDTNGNSANYTLAPAFVIQETTPPARRRTVGH